MVLKNKYTLLFIFLALISPFVLFLIKGGIGLPGDFVLVGLIDLILLKILGKKVELVHRKKYAVITLTMLVSILTPFWLLVLIFISPGQKEADHIMFDVCIPAVQKYYEQKEQKYGKAPFDKSGSPKSWYQVTECERNMHNGKGPVFSENPKEFKPVKK